MKKSMACMCMVCLVAWSTGATDRYVSTNGSHTAPFISWETAATNINAAVNLANTNNAGDTVWITNGTYVLTATVFVTNTIVRGFSGDPSDTTVSGNGIVRGFYLNHPNALVQDITISNGVANANPKQYYGGGACVVTGTLSHCVLANNTAATTSADSGHGGGAYCGSVGALITNCVFVTNYTGTGWSYTENAGGGLYVDSGLAVNCLFSNNAAYSRGGGAYVNSGGIISNSTFIGNHARDAGGLCLVTGTVANCLISNNWSTTTCGGVMIGGPNRGTYPSAPVPAILVNCTSCWNIAGNQGQGGGVGMTYGLVTNCLINNNSSPSLNGGGLYLTMTCTVANCTISGNNNGGIAIDIGAPLVVNCLITSNNNVIGDGGGIFYLNGARGAVVRTCIISANSNGGVGTGSGSGGLLLDRCSIIGNRSANGGGIRFYNSASTAQACRIEGNTAYGAGGTGGGAILDTKGTLANCLIVNNAATNSGGGGGVSFSGNNAYCQLYNCTVVSNRTEGAAGTGGGIYVGNPVATGVVVNCIVYANVSASGYNWASGGRLLATNSCSIPSLAAYGAGNITNDPKFVNVSAGDYHLAKGSPCIDKGLTQAWMYGVTDLDGRQRVQGGMVDMGVYEYVPTGTLIMMR